MRLHRAVSATRSLARLAAICVLAPGLAAAQPGDFQPLFATDATLELTLEAPIRKLVSRRVRRPEFDGRLSYVGDDGSPVNLDIEVRTRGKSRLQLCSFPPLSINMKRRQVEGTEFASQNRLKLVTRCGDSGRHEEYLQLEYLAYRIFGTFSEAAFRVRPVRMRYVDTERDNRVEEAPGFLIEHIEGVAARMGFEAAEVPSIDVANLDPRQTAAVAIFQYMIGNTDWSVTAAAQDEDCCHNTDVLVTPGDPARYWPVPYDFDQSGFVNTSYAEPNERLNISNVRQRLYRGFCATNAQIDEVAAAVVAARSQIESFIASAALSDDRRADTLDFLANGFAILNDPAQRAAQLHDNCRG